MVAAVKFPPFISASRWGTLNAQLWDIVNAKRGKNLARVPSREDGALVETLAPLLTNGDVVKLTMAFLAAMTPEQRRRSFPFWHQFAAAAYGWDPKKGTLDRSTKQRDAVYPSVLLVEFWLALQAATFDLDADNVPNARIDLDGTFADPVFQGEVVAALKADNGGVNATFKIPLPVCRGKDGKPTPLKCKRTMKRWPYLCEEYEKCDVVVITDPITDLKRKSDNALLLVALIVVAWAVFDNQPRHRRK